MAEHAYRLAQSVLEVLRRLPGAGRAGRGDARLAAGAGEGRPWAQLELALRLLGIEAPERM